MGADRQGYFWKESVVNEHLEDIMVTAFDEWFDMPRLMA